MKVRSTPLQWIRMLLKKERVYLTFVERFCILPGIKSVNAKVFLCAQVVPEWLVRSPVSM